MYTYYDHEFYGYDKLFRLMKVYGRLIIEYEHLLNIKYSNPKLKILKIKIKKVREKLLKEAERVYKSGRMEHVRFKDD